LALSSAVTDARVVAALVIVTSTNITLSIFDSLLRSRLSPEDVVEPPLLVVAQVNLLSWP
jgi:hypothetical protein